MTYTLDELTQYLLSLAYPSRMPKRLVPLRKYQVVQGLIEMQRRVPCLQEINTEVPTKTANCSFSTFPAPAGHITKIVVTQNPPEDPPTVNENAMPCVEIPCDFVGVAEMDALPGLYSRILQEGQSLDPVMPVSRFRFTIDTPSTVRMFPTIPDNWDARVKWDGIKKSYADDDIIDLTTWEDAIELLRTYLLYRGGPDEGCTGEETQAFLAMFNEQVRLLRHECKRRREAKITRRVYGASIQTCPITYGCGSQPQEAPAPTR